MNALTETFMTLPRFAEGTIREYEFICGDSLLRRDIAARPGGYSAVNSWGYSSNSSSGFSVLHAIPAKDRPGDAREHDRAGRNDRAVGGTF